MSSPCPSRSEPGLSSGQTSRVIRILENYLADLECGRAPEPDDLVARYPELAQVLRTYLEKLDVLHQAATGLRDTPSAEEFVAVVPQRGRLGDFQIRREVGRGGMGVVYEAEQISLDRRVALKVLPFATALDGKQLQRFKNEAQAAARLHHQHIVPVYAVGCERGVHYYAMQYIEGQTLATLIEELGQLAGLQPPDPGSSPLVPPDPTVEVPPPDSAPGGPGAGGSGPSPAAATARQRQTVLASDQPFKSPGFFRSMAQLGIQAAEALEYAHQQGVVHRDIKPANLLVDAKAHLWITDFGLARYGAEGGLTLTGDLVGTLRYMSPEQALGKRGLVDPRSDIYSLGVTLYELLTLQPACNGSDRQEVLRQIAFEEPRPPRRLNPAIPAELETILLKAMAKEPEGRYATARELAEDLRCFLENRPIRARRPTLDERLRKWVRRHKAAVFAGTVILTLWFLGDVAAAVLLWYEKDQTRAAVAQAQAQQAAAQTERNRAEQNFLFLKEGVTRLLLQLDDDKWANLPNISGVRRAMAEEMVRFMDGLHCKDPSDPGRRLEMGWAYLLVGNVYRVQGEGPKAGQAMEKAVAILETLAQTFPEEAFYRQELAVAYVVLGSHREGEHRSPEAADFFGKAAAAYREALRQDRNSRVLNNLAWFLATCPQAAFRNPEEAIALAREAVRQRPDCGESWNTLGAAHYRAGHWEEARAALEASMKLRDGGDGFDWFFLAMAYKQLGVDKKARYWYQRAVKRISKTNTYHEPVRPYWEEAAALLGEKLPCPK